MSMYTLLRNNPQPSVGNMEKAFEGTREFSYHAYVIYYGLCNNPQLSTYYIERVHC